MKIFAYFQGFHQTGLYVLDTMFSIFVVGTLVVLAWRGLWGIMDLTFFVNNRPQSALGSLVKNLWKFINSLNIFTYVWNIDYFQIIGYATVGTTFIIQPIVRCICKNVNGIFKLIICDIFYIMCFFGAVNTWRGIWMLLDVYLYPGITLM